MDLEPMLTCAEVARYLRVSRRTVRRWLAVGRLRGYRVGRGLRFDRGEIERFRQQCRYYNGRL